MKKQSFSCKSIGKNSFIGFLFVVSFLYCSAVFAHGSICVPGYGQAFGGKPGTACYQTAHNIMQLVKEKVQRVENLSIVVPLVVLRSVGRRYGKRMKRVGRMARRAGCKYFLYVRCMRTRGYIKIMRLRRRGVRSLLTRNFRAAPSRRHLVEYLNLASRRHYITWKKSNGDSCKKNTQCVSGACYGSICRRKCGSGSDCKSDQYCLLGKKVCLKKHALKEPCGTGSQCKSGHCIRGVCAERPRILSVPKRVVATKKKLHAACMLDSECASGMACFRAKCKLKIDQPCVFAGHIGCVTGRCDETIGKCAYKKKGDRCLYSSECASAFICVGGVCASSVRPKRRPPARIIISRSVTKRVTVGPSKYGFFGSLGVLGSGAWDLNQQIRNSGFMSLDFTFRFWAWNKISFYLEGDVGSSANYGNVHLGFRAGLDFLSWSFYRKIELRVRIGYWRWHRNVQLNASATIRNLALVSFPIDIFLFGMISRKLRSFSIRIQGDFAIGLLQLGAFSGRFTIVAGLRGGIVWHW